MQVLGPILITAQNILTSDFIQTCRRRNCLAFKPIKKLSDALITYGISKVLVDAQARKLLKDRNLISKFASNQKQGMSFEANIAKTFKGNPLVVSRSGDGSIVAFMAAPTNLSLARKVELNQTLQEETEIPVVRSSQLPTLAETELDFIDNPGEIVIEAHKKPFGRI
jgi:hypothetical protein